MLALWIILGILALFLLIALIPVKAIAVYDRDGARVHAKIGLISIPLYPRPPKQARPKKAKQEKKPKKEKKEKKEKPPEKEPGGGSIELFRELLKLVLEAQADIRNRLRIPELVLHLTVGGKGDDVSGAAVLYGSAWAAIGALWPQLERAFRIESRDVQVGIDYFSEKSTIYVKGVAAISIGSMVRLGGYYGLSGLKLYRKHVKKGGKENGTSNQ